MYNPLLAQNSHNNQNNSLAEFHFYYNEMISYIEKLHRLMVDVIKAELESKDITEINAVQALLLNNIGDSELTVGELKTHGYYLGSNVSYNLKKMVENGYVSYVKSHIDRRSMRIKLTESGNEIAVIVNNLYKNHSETLLKQDIANLASLKELHKTFQKFEKFWNNNMSPSA